MEFISLASSSKGNAYFVRAEGAGPLLVEAGLPISMIRDKLRAYGVMLSDLAGCLVSHEHGDHSKAVKDLLLAGIDCYFSNGTREALGIPWHHRFHPLFIGMTEGIPYQWSVTPFPLQHDAKEPFGFIILHGGERLLFIPDTAYVHNRFEGVTLLAVECNNIAEILNNNVLEGHIPAIVGKRIRRSHMSLENLITMLKANDLSRCRTIYLMHLSDGNSDERRMIQEVQAATGIPTEVCS